MLQTNSAAVIRLFTLATLVASCSVAKSAEFVELFDGKSLSGFSGDRQHWRVEDGRIIGEVPAGQTLRHNTWLVWDAGTVADFDLRVQVRLTGAPAANSGIQFRCQVESFDHVSGYQADLDQGVTWLGRIYDEHGRGLLVERGSRVLITADGERKVETFAPANQYTVLFRENDWNDYRIVASGESMSVFVNGTLFSQLVDSQIDAKDLHGRLAFQLHSGPETKVEFRSIRLKTLSADETTDVVFSQAPVDDERAAADDGVLPSGVDGASLNLGFERGDLQNWTATGDAFGGQPVDQDGIATRWAGQTSNKQGSYFVGGFEVVQDKGTGQLVSDAFEITHPFASFLVGGGENKSTRVDLMNSVAEGTESRVLFSASGRNREQMERVAVDLREYQGESIVVRVVDENSGAWGHINFDDFRFHDQRPPGVEAAAWRSTANPLLHQLRQSPSVTSDRAADQTIAKMYLPPGFSAEVVAAEPRLHQPMAFTFDCRGRIWVVEGHSYPQKRPEGQGLDRILIFEDADGDGSFESRKVFIEGLNLVSGLEVGFGGVWIGAAPQLLFIPDLDGNDIPDSQPQVLLDGFGFADTHETINSLIWGPDGWLYGNQGVFNSSQIGAPDSSAEQRTYLAAGVWRYHPQRKRFEVFAHGGSNQWGLDFNEFGQLFMTHCRSFWGTGPTTHVRQGGHYWNQVNSGHAPFIATSPRLANYMLASARYGHGEGGAGKPGSRAVYGGHSHVGTMIYLGDNWPNEYRHQLFTHNLHGHQMNRQVNRRRLSGYDTVHAGSDMLFCADPQYIGVDLRYGPDGAVYISDWYDPRHCHNPNAEQWDRGNGRLYRVKYDATYRPATLDMSKFSDDQLVEAQNHPNDWHARTSRRILQQRAAEHQLTRQTIDRIRQMALSHPDATRRLRALWTLHAVGGLGRDIVDQLLGDENEFIRGWCVQLAVDSQLDREWLADSLLELARRDRSLLVRSYLATAISRTRPELGWPLASILVGQADNAADRDLTLMIWYGVAGLMSTDIERAFQLVEQAKIPVVNDFLNWYAAKISDRGRELVMQGLIEGSDEERSRLLSLFREGIGGARGLSAPDGWSLVSQQLYESTDDQARASAEALGAAFGDQHLFNRLRNVLQDNDRSIAERRHALSLLAADDSPKNLPIYLAAIENEELRRQAIPRLAAYRSDAIAARLIELLPEVNAEVNAAAMNVLTSRERWASELLDQISQQRLDRKHLTAYFARQIANLGSEDLRRQLEEQWGVVASSSAQRQAEIEQLTASYAEAPLWAYSAGNGSQHFAKLCVACHQPRQPSERVGPKLDGIGSKGIAYSVENILDPNAVIGQDFLARTVLTVDGRTLSGLILDETDSAITLKTATETLVIAHDDVEQVVVSKNSFMPEGLLQTLNDRERIELLKYLMSL
jgi:putative membrane-bound dehydrogenase-like protein